MRHRYHRYNFQLRVPTWHPYIFLGIRTVIFSLEMVSSVSLRKPLKGYKQIFLSIPHAYTETHISHTLDYYFITFFISKATSGLNVGAFSPEILSVLFYLYFLWGNRESLYIYNEIKKVVLTNK